MILEVEEAVRRVAPAVLGPGRVSVACVQTTRPKYLVFQGDSTCPRCVVQFGTADDLVRLDAILRRLHQEIPGMVPEPLGMGRLEGGLYVQVQSGLGGAPWFRLQREYATPRAWMGLLERAADTLRHLESAIGRCPEWVRQISPAAEIRSQLRIWTARAPVPAAVKALVEREAAALEALGPMEAHAQHGDYALNNLLVDDDRIGIIDFDEFGLTFMPLHDRTGLAVSMLTLAPQGVTATLNDYLSAVRASGEASSGDTVLRAHEMAFVLHHLLSRINLSHGIGRRAAAGAWLTDVLLQLAA